MSSENPMAFGKIPNEVLRHVLDQFSTRDLLSLAVVSHRFYSAIVSLIHHRLLEVSSLPQHMLMFDCYHPRAKLTALPMSCEHLTTKAMGGNIGAGSNTPTLSELQQIYSSFRLVLAEEYRSRRRSDQDEGEGQNDGINDDGDKTVFEDVFIDEGNLFSQLCAVTNIIKPGPRAGIYLGHVNIGDSVLRVWREWLAKMAIGTSNADQVPEAEQILWVDADQSIGVRFKVMHGAEERMPVLSGPDDCPAINYKLQYEELMVRTDKILLATEESAVQEISNSGKAIIFVSMG